MSLLSIGNGTLVPCAYYTTNSKKVQREYSKTPKAIRFGSFIIFSMFDFYANFKSYSLLLA